MKFHGISPDSDLFHPISYGGFHGPVAYVDLIIMRPSPLKGVAGAHANRPHAVM
jgi:hypothetical protein